MVKRITPLADSDADALAVKIELTDGRTDYVMWSAGKSRSWKDGGHVLGTDGRFAIRLGRLSNGTPECVVVLADPITDTRWGDTASVERSFTPPTDGRAPDTVRFALGAAR